MSFKEYKIPCYQVRCYFLGDVAKFALGINIAKSSLFSAYITGFCLTFCSLFDLMHLSDDC